MSKKLLLLSFMMSGVIIGAEKLGSHNCNVSIMSDTVSGTDEKVYTLFFFHKNNPNELLFISNYFNRPIKSTNWDNQKPGFLHIHFEDGTNVRINVNKP